MKIFYKITFMSILMISLLSLSSCKAREYNNQLSMHVGELISIDDLFKLGKIEKLSINDFEMTLSNDYLVLNGKTIEAKNKGITIITFTNKKTILEITVTITDVETVEKKVIKYSEIASYQSLNDLFSGDFGTINKIENSDPSVISMNENNKLVINSLGSTNLTVYGQKASKQIEVEIIPEVVVIASPTIKRGGAQNISINFIPSDYSEEYTITSSDEDILYYVSGRMIKGGEPGKATITVTTTKGYIGSTDIEVLEVYYNITYINTDNTITIPESAPKTYSLLDLPLILSTLEKADYVFLGWQINGTGSYKVEDLVFELPTSYKSNITLRPVFAKARLEIRYETDSLIKVNENLSLNVKAYNIPRIYDAEDIVWVSKNPEIASVDEYGNVSGKAIGYAEIFAYLKSMENVNMSIGVNVMSEEGTMNELLEYLVENSFSEIQTKYINVIAYQGNYLHLMKSAVSRYLYEDLVITEHLAPIGASNRPGTIFDKHYITVHDTASGATTANAAAHARYVSDQGGEGTSWHYSVGNDGIYHQIPNNEKAYHAGDGSREYTLTDSGVKGTNKYPIVTISTDGYYELDGNKTTILAPTNNGIILKTQDINDMGIRVVLQNGKYYIGNTYYNTTYLKIANGGGNTNAIGIEMCVNQGSDIYYTWQKNAKLVAQLLVENNLTVDDVKPHHFFSGKDCPATMLHADMWEMFLQMIEVEYTIKTQFPDYKITLTTTDKDYLKTNGKIINLDPLSKVVNYTIIVEKDGQKESINMSTIIPGKLTLVG